MRAEESKLRRKVAAGALLVVACVLASSSSSVATDPVNVFSGSWSTTATGSSGSAGGSLTLSVTSAADGASKLAGLGGTCAEAGATYYTGSFSSSGLTGGVAGCTSTSPDHLLGQFGRSDFTNGVGSFDITLTAPGSFSGHIFYSNTQYMYTGKTAAGSAPSGPPSTSPPTSTPPTGSTPIGSSPTGSTPGGASSPSGSTPSGSSPTLSVQGGAGFSSGSAAPAGSGRVIVAEPAPGESVTLGSPNPLAGNASATALSVSDSLGDFPGSTIVGPGELRTQPSGTVVACWLIGPDALQVPPGFYGKNVDLKFFYGRLNASDAFTACAGVARAASAASAARPTAAASQAQGSGCAARRLEVKISAHSGLITAARPVESPVAGQSEVVYHCMRAGDGSLKISIAARRKGGLHATLGDQLRLGVVRAVDATARSATLTFGFGASWTGRWHSTRGAMRLTQTGVQVTGTYAACGGTATITGRLTGQKLDGKWSQGCDSRSGRLNFTIASDGQNLTGKWSSGRASPAATWNASRSAGR